MDEMVSLEKQKSQSGQALVEYVLLLVIAIALILGLSYQFYKPLGNWVENQMGPYLECLLDIGELPALGGQAESECAETYQPFGEGRGLEASIGGNRKSAKRKDLSRDQNKNSESGGGGGGSEGGSGGDSGRSRGFRIGENRGADGEKGTEGSETMTEKLPASKYYRFRSASNLNSSGQQQTYVTELVSLYPIGKLRTSRKEKQTFSVGTIDQEGGGSKAQRMIIKPAERKIAAEEPDEPWSFGKYIKFLLIILIVVAIILFLAGQISQISKSMEK